MMIFIWCQKQSREFEFYLIRQTNNDKFEGDLSKKKNICFPPSENMTFYFITFQYSRVSKQTFIRLNLQRDVSLNRYSLFSSPRFWTFKTHVLSLAHVVSGCEWSITNSIFDMLGRRESLACLYEHENVEKLNSVTKQRWKVF